MIANNISPAQYWGKKFINSTSRKYVILSGFTENVEEIENSLVFFTDEKGKMLTTSGMKWSIFLITYVPSMLKEYVFEE